MNLDLEAVKERYRMYADERDAGKRSMDVQTHAIEPLLDEDVPAMLAEMERNRALLGVYGALYDLTKRLCDDASLLAAYVAGVVKTGAGSKQSVRNMLDPLEQSIRAVKVLRRTLESDKERKDVSEEVARTNQ